MRIERLGEATRWRYVYLVTQGGLSLGLFIVLGQLLPGVAFPACATALGVLVIAQAAGDFGLSQAAVAVLPNPGALNTRLAREELESGAALAFVLAAAAAIILCLVGAVLVPASAAGAVIAVAPAAAMAVVVAGTDGILRAEGEFRRPVMIVAASRIGAFAGLPAAAGSGGSATAACLGVSAGTVLCSLPAVAVIAARLRGGDPRASVGPFAAAAAPLGAANLAVIASARLNTIVLGGFASLRSAAVFEGAWRLFAVGQYAVGGAPNAAGPFIAQALGGAHPGELRHALRRAAGLVVIGGGLVAAALVLARNPLGRVLFGDLGPPIGRSLLWLGPVLPLNLLALLMTLALAASSSADRRWLAGAYGLGAAVNLALVLATASAHPDVAGAVGAAAGMVATSLVLAGRLRCLMEKLAHRPVGTGPSRGPEPTASGGGGQPLG